MFRKIYICIFMLISASAVRYKNCWPYGSLLRHENDQGSLEYCTTKERPPQIVLLGDKMETRDCYQCTCTSDGLYCCGIGIHEFTGSIEVPDGCQLVVRGCNYSLVQKQNSFIPCF